jgi:GxxExxY protein
MAEENYKHSEITDLIIKAFYIVYNTLGYGFLEKVYENAMLIELKKMGLNATAQHAVKVYYDNQQVGGYFADLFVENCVIVELKTAEGISIENEAQLVNYLKATEIEVGLVMNFGKKAQFKKKAFSNEFKESKTVVD